MLIPSVLRQSLEMRTLSQIAADELGALRRYLPVLHVRDVDHCDESFLPWLAWEFRVAAWDDTWPVATKRDVVKAALMLFRIKGTPWAVKVALATSGYRCSLTEWHSMRPVGPRGTFHIGIDTAAQLYPIDNRFYQNIFNIVESNKRGSQHWTAQLQSNERADIYLPVVVQVHIKMSIKVESHA